MARQIKMESSKIRELVTKFAEWLGSAKVTNGKVNFSADLGKIDRKAKLTFTGIAYLKMQWLISTLSTECGWYGIVNRSETDDDEYIVSDIVIYPQSVTGSTVTIDESELANWQMDIDDEVFNHLRMHGHSHVQMGVTPSGTDEDHYSKILSTLRQDDFYVFAIFNKKGDHTIRIYDYAKNIYFETADVELLVQTDDGCFEFMESADEMITTKSFSWQNGKPSSGTTTPVGGYIMNQTTTTQVAGGKTKKSYPAYEDDDDDWREYDEMWYGGAYYGGGAKK